MQIDFNEVQNDEDRMRQSHSLLYLPDVKSQEATEKDITNVVDYYYYYYYYYHNHHHLLYAEYLYLYF